MSYNFIKTEKKIFLKNFKENNCLSKSKQLDKKKNHKNSKKEAHKDKDLWCFLFCKENVTLLQGALKKLPNSPVIM